MLARTAGLSALQSLPACKVVIPIGQFIPRGLATATAPKKAVRGVIVTKKVIPTKATKAPVKKKTATTSISKKAAPKTAVQKKKKGTTAKAANPSVKKPKRTEEEKQRQHIRSLIERALDPPHRQTSSPWVSFLKEKFDTYKGPKQGVGAILGGERANWSKEYKALTQAQLAAYQDRAVSTKDTKQQEFNSWVVQHTPAEIHEANRARAALRHIKAKSNPVPFGLKSKTFAAIPDERYPLRPRSANVLYVKEKFASVPKEKKFGSLGTLMKEFTTLPEAEKQKWKERSAQDLIRFHRELKSIGIQPAS